MSITWAHVSQPRAGRRRLVIFASKLAGCAGMHPYMNQDEMRFEFQKAMYGDAAEEFIPEGYELPAQVEKREKESMPDAAKDILKQALDDLPNLPAEKTADAVKDVANEISKISGMSEDAKNIVRRELYTSHGVQGESAIRDAVAKDNAVEIRADNKFRCSRELARIGEFDVFVGGKHDGIADGDDCIVEIKNRVRRHLGAPLYERVQLHAYMDIFGVSHGLLIENYKGSRKEHDVYFDQDFWNSVVESATEFVETCMLPLADEKIEEMITA